MPTRISFEQCVQCVTLLLTLATIFRLYASGLHRKYRFFFWYLIFSFLQAGGSLLLGSRSKAYFWAWLAAEPVVWFFYIQVVLELYWLILQDYKGIYTMGRWLVQAVFLISVAISTVSLLSSWNSVLSSRILLYYTMIERGVVFSLVIFLLLMLVSVAWYPVPLSRNVMVYCVVYSIYFLSNTMGLLALNLTGQHITPLVNDAMSVVTALCFVAWLFLLNARGEGKKMVLRLKWNEEHEKRLTDQLSAINSALLRAARK